VRRIAKAHAVLFQRQASDQGHVDRCEAAGDKAAKYLEINLTDVVVSSYRTGAGVNDDVPHETITLNFSKIEKEYFSTDNKGVATSAGKGTWNFQTKASS